MKPSDLIPISTFQSKTDAEIARGLLADAGIESVIRSDDIGGMYPGIAGTELLVRAADFEKASEALQRSGEDDSSRR
jgi:hypothetical protein